MMRFSSLLLAGVCMVGAAAVPAWAEVNYGDYLGTNPGDVDFLGISEDSPTDPLPLFGAPTRVGNQLLFFPQTFQSFSADGATDTTAGTLTVTVRADAGYYLDMLVIEEYGDYSVAGVGTSATFADVTATLTATDITPGTNGVLVDVLAMSPAGPYALPGDGSGPFCGGAVIDLRGLGVTEVLVQFENVLQTSSEVGTTAYIGKRVIGGPAVGISVIPEPVSACVLLVGGVVLLRRRFR